MFHRQNKLRDEHAFMDQFQKFEQDVYRMAYVYVKNREDALDIVQETAYRAFKNFSGLKDTNLFKTWIIKITINTAIDLLRKQNKIVLLNSESEKQLQNPCSESSVLSLSLKDLLETALSEDEKTVLLLKYCYEYTFDEISKIVGAPASTIKSTVYRALKKVKQKSMEENYL